MITYGVQDPVDHLRGYSRRLDYGAILPLGALTQGIRIGAYSSVGAQLIVRRRNHHPVDGPVPHPFSMTAGLGNHIKAVAENPLEIGSDVWIGDRVTILGGCRKIDNGAVIGAGAVATRDIAPYVIVAGVPARLIRMRFGPELVAALEASRWWERSISELIGDPHLTTLLDARGGYIGDGRARNTASCVARRWTRDNAALTLDPTPEPDICHDLSISSVPRGPGSAAGPRLRTSRRNPPRHAD